VAALGVSSRPGLSLFGAGEGALHVAEELVVDARRLEPRAIEVQKRLAGALAAGVKLLGQFALPHPAFAENEHRRLLWRCYRSCRVERRGATPTHARAP